METLNCSMLDVLVGPFDVLMDMVGAKASTMRKSDEAEPVDDHPIHSPGMMRMLKTLGTNV